MYPFKNLHRVYCAGPLFNQIERDEMVRIADVLVEEGFVPFVPHRDGMEFAKVQPYLVRNGHNPAWVGHLLHEAVFALDAYQVMIGCGSVVCNLNGRVPDEGAVAESAMAWAWGKPLVLYKDDVRSKIAGRDNPLVVGMTCFEAVHRIEDIVDCLREKIAEMVPDPEVEYPCPPHLRDTLLRGERLWLQLAELGEERPSPQVAEIILDLFGSTKMPI
ncbi:Nucleoside 2-deoxyribosyltransferase [Planctomycetales bacterium 10988]|nr:Nucleoside 2-deoxyribosyltransferase [Planctomycetales bacterium 10988]